MSLRTQWKLFQTYFLCENLTWKCEVSPCWLVSNSIIHNLQMLSESIGHAPVCLRHKLLLALGAGDQVDQVARLAVHPAVDFHLLA